MLRLNCSLSTFAHKKVKEWRMNYEAMKENMMGEKQKGKQGANKKGKLDNKKKGKGKPELKRKSETKEEVGSQVKRKRDSGVEEKAKENDSGGGVKRPRDDNDDKATENKRQRTESGSSSTQQSDRESCTLFVSNLEFKVNEENLREKLSEFGEIVSMRVKAGVKAFGGSICYCQYETPKSVDEALKHDRTPLDGRPMFLSRYAANNSKPMFKYPTTAEKNKLFVRNLPFGKCSKEALTDVFEKYGTLKDIRIVTHKDGKPKGLAYVEYEDEKSASEALKATDGLQLSGREIRVALSEPPPKNASASASASSSVSASAPPTRTRRTQLSSFIPSVLQKAAVPNTTSNGKGDHNGDNAPLSNADFRNMLLKK